MSVHIFLWHPAFNSWEELPRNGIAGSLGNFIVNFLRNNYTVPHSGWPFYIPIYSTQGFQFLLILTNTWYFLFLSCYGFGVFFVFVCTEPSWWAWGDNFVLILSFPSDYPRWASFHVLVGHLCFWRNVCSSLLPILKLSLLSCISSIHILDISSLLDTCFASIFP